MYYDYYRPPTSGQQFGTHPISIVSNYLLRLVLSFTHKVNFPLTSINWNGKGTKLKKNSSKGRPESLSSVLPVLEKVWYKVSGFSFF